MTNKQTTSQHLGQHFPTVLPRVVVVVVVCMAASDSPSVGRTATSTDCQSATQLAAAAGSRLIRGLSPPPPRAAGVDTDIDSR